eukprot:CAMPEP_0116856524 /NCGR_PEP_ID=MMETSP0418-20121206/19965_1 /TAXON_ID=1158023 /ORGANISM="Astrosyne radiata, Strain 13vi08-1A" /LENGTH=237 /DNA_ID=CAMNT_0004489945 /DNA_START=221 /DNA_END=935 /DNA_ORIENTATION=-
MNRYSTGKFDGQYKATIGADFLSKEVVVSNPYTGQQTLAGLQIWDTAGQERFQSLGMGFYRGADAVLLVYDITDPHSLDSLDRWRNEFLSHIGGGLSTLAQSFPFVVLGNKIDKAMIDWFLEHVPKSGVHAFFFNFLQANDRLVPRTRAEEWCAKAAAGGGLGVASNQALPHFETSAKSAINVDEAFLEAATLALLYEDRKRQATPQLFVPPTQTIDLNAHHQHHRSTTTRSNDCCG